MKKTLTILLLAASIFSLGSLQSCKPEDDPPTPATEADFTLQFNHVFGMSQEVFELNKQLIHPKTGDTMIFTKLKYYISNIQLKKSDGSWWVQPESYHLVDLGAGDNFKLTIKDVPVGTYSAMRFMHGVDSTRNVSGAQEGALSISNNMFWGWNSGYIMLKAEGNSPQATNGNFAYHLGGFSGDFNVITEKEAEFGSSSLEIKGDSKPTVHMMVNPAKLWHTVGSMTGIPNAAHAPSEMTTDMAIDIFGWTNFKEITP